MTDRASEEWEERFAALIRQSRAAVGASQADLASKLDVSEATIWKVEHSRRVRRSTARAMVRALVALLDRSEVDAPREALIAMFGDELSDLSRRTSVEEATKVAHAPPDAAQGVLDEFDRYTDLTDRRRLVAYLVLVRRALMGGRSLVDEEIVRESLSRPDSRGVVADWLTDRWWRHPKALLKALDAWRDPTRMLDLFNLTTTIKLDDTEQLGLIPNWPVDRD